MSELKKIIQVTFGLSGLYMLKCVVLYIFYHVSVYLYSFGKIFSQSLHSWTGSSLSSRSCLKSSLSVSKMEPVLEHEYFWCRRSSSVEENSSSQSSQRYICSSAHTHAKTHLFSHQAIELPEIYNTHQNPPSMRNGNFYTLLTWIIKQQSVNNERKPTKFLIFACCLNCIFQFHVS